MSPRLGDFGGPSVKPARDLTRLCILVWIWDGCDMLAVKLERGASRVSSGHYIGASKYRIRERRKKNHDTCLVNLADAVAAWQWRVSPGPAPTEMLNGQVCLCSTNTGPATAATRRRIVVYVCDRVYRLYILYKPHALRTRRLGARLEAATSSHVHGGAEHVPGGDS